MKCFYHSADFDGQCSGAIIKSKYPNCEMIGIDYNDEFPFETISSLEVVFMVDFSLPIKDMIILNDLCKLHWIDHHDTIIKDAYNSCFLASGGQILDTGKAACELTWEYINKNKKVPYSVKLLSLYDSWTYDDSNKDEVLSFQFGMRTFNNTKPNHVELWENIFNIKLIISNIIKKGKPIWNYQKEQYKKGCEYAFYVEFEGKKAICLNSNHFSSLTFDSVYDINKHDIMINFCRTNEKKWKIGIYSDKDDVHCGELAKLHGGGGHKGAAGFLCKTLPFEY